jgi:hypothetical protein
LWSQGHMSRLKERQLSMIVRWTVGSIPGLLKLAMQETMKLLAKRNRT